MDHGESGNPGAPSGMPCAPLVVDVDQVDAVASFYRRAALVLSAAGDDMAVHHFGGWAVGPGYRALGERYAVMSAVVADRLREQAAAADGLSELLGRGLDELVDADAAQAHQLGGIAERDT